MLDSSGSLTPMDFERAKDFIYLMGKSFLQNKVGSRIGLIQYSIVPTLHVQFSEKMTYEKFRSILQRVPYQGGHTRLDRALALAAERLFADPESSRKDVPKIMVVLTDGVNTESADSVALDAAVAPLHRAGVRVFVVSVGSEEGQGDLYLLTQQSQDLHSVRTYDELALQLRRISRDACESGGKFVFVKHSCGHLW